MYTVGLLLLTLWVDDSSTLAPSASTITLLVGHVLHKVSWFLVCTGEDAFAQSLVYNYSQLTNTPHCLLILPSSCIKLMWEVHFHLKSKSHTILVHTKPHNPNIIVKLGGPLLPTPPPSMPMKQKWAHRQDTPIPPSRHDVLNNLVDIHACHSCFYNACLNM